MIHRRSAIPLQQSNNTFAAVPDINRAAVSHRSSIDKPFSFWIQVCCVVYIGILAFHLLSKPFDPSIPTTTSTHDLPSQGNAEKHETFEWVAGVRDVSRHISRLPFYVFAFGRILVEQVPPLQSCLFFLLYQCLCSPYQAWRGIKWIAHTVIDGLYWVLRKVALAVETCLTCIDGIFDVIFRGICRVIKWLYIYIFDPIWRVVVFIYDCIAGLLRSIWDALSGILRDVWDFIWRNAVDAARWIWSKIIFLVDTFGWIFGIFWDAIVDFLRFLATHLLEPILDAIAKGVNNIWLFSRFLFDLLRVNLLDPFWNFIVMCAEAIKGCIITIFKLIHTAVNECYRIVRWLLWKFVVILWNVVVFVFDLLWDYVLAPIGNAFVWIWSLVCRFASFIYSCVEPILSIAYSVVKNMTSYLFNLASDILSQIGHGFYGVYAQVSVIFWSVYETAIQSVWSAYNTIGAAISEAYTQGWTLICRLVGCQ